MARRGMASGNLELAHIIVNKYRFPDFVFGKVHYYLLERSLFDGYGFEWGYSYAWFGFSRLLTGVTRITKFLRAGFDAWPVEVPY